MSDSNIAIKLNFKKDYLEYPGAGAAGGVGFALQAYFKAKFYPGIDYILESIDFDKFIIENAIIDK